LYYSHHYLFIYNFTYSLVTTGSLLCDRAKQQNSSKISSLLTCLLTLGWNNLSSTLEAIANNNNPNNDGQNQVLSYIFLLFEKLFQWDMLHNS